MFSRKPPEFPSKGPQLYSSIINCHRDSAHSKGREFKKRWQINRQIGAEAGQRTIIRVIASANVCVPTRSCSLLDKMKAISARSTAAATSGSSRSNVMTEIVRLYLEPSNSAIGSSWVSNTDLRFESPL